MQFDMGNSSAYDDSTPTNSEKLLSTDITQLIIDIRQMTNSPDDLVLRPFRIGSVDINVVMFEGQVSNLQVSDLLLRKLSSITQNVQTAEELIQLMRQEMLPATDQKEIRTYAELFNLAMSGFAVLTIDGSAVAFAYGYQGFVHRSVGEPSVEKNLKGSKEAFTEAIVPNVSLVRRRIKSQYLAVDAITVGSISNTRVKLLYLSNIADPQMIKRLKEQLAKVPLRMIVDSGYLRPFLETGKLSLLSGTGETERPDTLCAKINEGRVGILVDGSPFAIIVPYLFVEHFQAVDDYLQRPYFATFMRILRIVSFFATIFLPGYYVAVITYHYELIPQVLLDSIVRSTVYTPLSPMAEALIVFVMYELLREAGLRLPTPIGHAISVVGGLVIGDAAVTAGLVGLPMIILIAVTAISAFVIPTLYEPATTMRFVFILVGGLLGLYGVYLGAILFIINLTSLKTLDIPITAPIAPFDPVSLRDMAVRAGWDKLGEKTLKVQDLPGTDKDR